MSNEKPAVVLPVQDVQLQTVDDKLMLGLETAQGAVAALMPLDRTALLSLRMLYWVSCQPPGEQTARGDAMTVHDLRFEDAQSDRSIVLAVDLGAATLRFEVLHSQLGAALAQLKPLAGEPPKPH